MTTRACAAAGELGRINLAPERVVPALEIALLRESDEAVRRAMRESLESLLEKHPRLGRGPSPPPGPGA
jgi:hypothetical protein